MTRLDVERKYVRSDGRIKVLLRDTTDRRSTLTLLREPDDANEFTEGGQADRTAALDSEARLGQVRVRSPK